MYKLHVREVVERVVNPCNTETLEDDEMGTVRKPIKEPHSCRIGNGSSSIVRNEENRSV